MFFREPIMAEKYPIKQCGNLEDYVFVRVCRYADGYVYRIQKQYTLPGDLMWETRLVFHSVTKAKIYITPMFDDVRIYMKDFENGVAFATRFEILFGETRKRFSCEHEIWNDTDVLNLENTLKKKFHYITDINV